MTEEVSDQGTQPESEVLNVELLAMLVCPVDKARLELVGETLVCAACQRVYPIELGIPNMIVESEF